MIGRNLLSRARKQAVSFKGASGTTEGHRLLMHAGLVRQAVSLAGEGDRLLARAAQKGLATYRAVTVRERLRSTFSPDRSHTFERLTRIADPSERIPAPR
jgi:hypothetical protein